MCNNIIELTVYIIHAKHTEHNSRTLCYEKHREKYQYLSCLVEIIAILAWKMEKETLN